MTEWKERFINRYKNTIDAYFNYPGNGEGHRAILYVMEEYQRILEEEFDMSYEEVRAIYDEKYDKKYTTCI